MARDDRDRNLRVRVSDHEMSMLVELASAEGLSQSDYLRLYIRHQHAAKFGAQTPTKGAKPKPKK